MKEFNWQYLTPAAVNNDGLPDDLKEFNVWINNIYTVFVRKCKPVECWPAMTWLSIKRNDKEPCKDWRHFQWIKNQLCGPENEAVELYPAESRLTDSSNQYHLWVIDNPQIKFPFGFNDGRNITRNPLPNGKQRDFPGNMLPDDIEECETRLDEAMKQIFNNNGAEPAPDK